MRLPLSPAGEPLTWTADRRVRLAVWTLTLVAAVALLWRSPFSPLAVDRGDVLYGQGHPSDAVAHWEAVGRWHPLASARVRAQLRAATVAEVDLDDAETSRRILRSLLDHGGAPAAVQADAWERIGHLEWTDFGDPDAAASAFELAWRMAPDDPRASERLVQSARARTDAAQRTEALRAWDRVAAKAPEHRSLARIAQASMLLADNDPTGALDAYEEALAHTSAPALRQAARLGAATCKERLGRIEAALADLESADLPADVVLERRRRLEERAQPM